MTGSASGDPADDPAAIGRRIQQLRLERGLTQRELAEPDYTAAHVSTLEAGKGRPSETALRYLAEKLGVTPDELATGRPAHLATGLRARLGDAQRTLATGSPADAVVEYEKLYREAADNELRAEQAAAALGIGQCALETGELGRAREHFETAERMLADAAPAQRARAVSGRAVAHLLGGELRYACYLLETALHELDASGLNDPDALLILYTAAIAPYMDMGAHARAAQAAELALALAPQVEDPAAVAHLHRQVARTLIAEGRFAEADASLGKASELYQQLQIRTELALCHWMRGYVRAQHDDLDQAEFELRTAREMLTSRRAVLYVAQVEVELADVLRRRGKAGEARLLLHGLLGEVQPDTDVASPQTDVGAVHAGGAHRLLGLMAEEEGDDESAEVHYVGALSLLETAGAAGDLADLCRLLGDLYRRTGRLEAALDAYRTGLGHRAAPGTTTLGPAPSRPPGLSGGRA